MLHQAFPTLFKLEIGEEEESANGAVHPSKNFDVICHGLKIDLRTPLYWLQLNMSYLDNFIYVSINSS